MIATDLSNSFHPVPKIKTEKKKQVKKIKGKKHKQTKATEIPQKVKKVVWERDKHKCILCHKLVPVECGNAHLIKRSQRWFRNRREHSHIMPRMSLSRRPRTKY